jgi:hypothetical protein
MTVREERQQATQAVMVPASPSTGSFLRSVAQTALLTLALSLPQGLLALPIAVAQIGLAPGLLILVLIGALNTATVAWVARHTIASYLRCGTVPSLAMLAVEHLGPNGKRLAIASGAGLFFLGLLASLVGLARSLGEGTQTPSWLWGLGCGLALLLATGGRAALSTRLVTWLGLLNLGLLGILLLMLLLRAQSLPTPLPVAGVPLMMVGVSLMLFFAPMLIAPVARQVLPGTAEPRALIWGSAAGVALNTGLLALWAVAVCSSTSGPALAAASGTALPLVLAALPEGRVPVTLFGLLLLGMTALRCTLVLKTLTDEQLPLQLQRGRALLVQLPAGVGLLIALALLLADASSFTQLIAVAGAGTASIVNLVIPSLLRWRAADDSARPDGRIFSGFPHQR